MKVRINWKEVQSYYDSKECTLKELHDVFNINSYATFWKAKSRGDFIPRSTSDAINISIKRGRRKILPISEDVRKKISDTVNLKVENGEWHASIAKKMRMTYKGIVFHGLWEVMYAKWLDENNISWRRPNENFKYNFLGKVRRYTPDFYLIDENVYIEIKGYETEKDKSKWEQFPLKHRVLKYDELKSIGLDIKR